MAHLPPPRNAVDVNQLFFPGATSEILADLWAQGEPYRADKFLPALDFYSYLFIYEYLLDRDENEIRFPDIQLLLRTGRHDTKVASQIITHVIQWINPSLPSNEKNDSGNRSLLWHDLVPAFSSNNPEQAKAEARGLQRHIFDIIRGRIAELTAPAMDCYLSQMPNIGDGYLERFEHPVWRDILALVDSVASGRFKGPLAKFNTQGLGSLLVQPTSRLVPAFRTAICRIPEVACNPVLRAAIDPLISDITPLIISWAMKQCKEGLRAQDLGKVPPWPSSIRVTINALYLELGQHIKIDSTDSTLRQVCSP